MSKMDWVEAAAENPEAKRRWLVGIVASAASAVHLGPWACLWLSSSLYMDGVFALLSDAECG